MEKHIDNAVVILDSLNYIKGFRYELFNLSRTAKSTYGVVSEYFLSLFSDCS